MNSGNNTAAEMQQERHLDDILNNIKEVITNKTPNIEVFELTDKIENSSNDNSAKPVQFENIAQQPDRSQQFSDNSMQSPKASSTMKNPDLTHSDLLKAKVAQESKETLKGLLRFAEMGEIDALPLRSGSTVEDIVIDLLKPQLKEWLNKNLPDIVSDIIQKEIKKLIPQDE
jgi:hypothetical protein